MKIDIGLHTVIILTGPSQSGKSTWTKLFQEKVKQTDEKLRTTIISSDEIRRRLLGEDLHRYDKRMGEVSEAAFDLLFDELKAAIRFPVNNEFVIIDTTGMDIDFRQKIIGVAHEHTYRTAIVMFDYATNDYFHGLSSFDKTIVGKQVDTFKKKVLPSIKRKAFDYSYSIKAKNDKFFKNIELNIIDYALWRKSNIFMGDWDNKVPVAIIGDVHEHVDALKIMLSKIPEKAHIVFVGDLFDKGQQTEKMLDYAEELIKQGVKIVRGNHESFVARRLKGEVDAVAIEKEFFPSLSIFQADKVLADRFLKIYEETLPFLCIKTHGKSIYVTHAPCYNKTLGKLDEKSQKFQRNFYFSSRNQPEMKKELDFISKEAKFSHPAHIFGHVAHDLKNMVDKNKVWLDTGAVYGNRLSAVLISSHGEMKVISQKTDPLTTGKLLKEMTEEERQQTIMPPLPRPKSIWGDKGGAIEKESVGQNTTLSSELANDNLVEQLSMKYPLSPEDKYWLYKFEESGAKFISGTMSPSRSTRTLLEPIDTALQYFKAKGIDKVIIEPKYMGSRLQLYLHRDRRKDFAVTRSGVKSGHQEMLKAVFDDWHEQLDGNDCWKESIILDGELLPWSAIGKELIEKDFVQYGKTIEKEWELLSSDVNFNKFASHMGIDIPTEQKGIETFLKQLEIYGADYPVEYKPFSVLSVDGELWVEKNQEEVFTWLLPNEKYKVIDLNHEKSVDDAREFFNTLTEMNEKEGFAHEGVVVKPLIYQTGVAPYMKVRNENYLHLIYGYDYLKKYQEKVSNKKINKKLDLSMKEYEIGLKMLQTSSKKELLELACQMKFEINQEKELDSRL